MKGMGLLTKALVGLVVFSSLSAAYFGAYQDSELKTAYGLTTTGGALGSKTEEVMAKTGNMTENIRNIPNKNFLENAVDSIFIGLDMLSLSLEIPGIIQASYEDIENMTSTDVGLTLPPWFGTMITSIILIVIVMFIAGIVLKREL